MGDQQDWPSNAMDGRETTVEKTQAVIQRPLKRGTIGKRLTDNPLLGDRLVGPLNESTVH
jgi:hypothetical protein